MDWMNYDWTKLKHWEYLTQGLRRSDVSMNVIALPVMGFSLEQLQTDWASCEWLQAWWARVFREIQTLIVQQSDLSHRETLHDNAPES